MGERIVVTGGAGFIGSHLVDALVARGAEVHIVDNLVAGRREQVPAQAHLHEIDVSDVDALQVLALQIGPIDRWFHLAAQIDVRISVEQPVLDATVNVIGTVAVLAAARHHGASVTFASTGGAIYGECHDGPANESAPERPESPYGAAKLAAEILVAQDARLNGARHCIVRYANVYGPRQDPHGEGGVVAIFGGKVLDGATARVYGTGLQTRDYTYVGDTVRATIAASDAAVAGTDAELRTDGNVPIYNVGTGIETTVVELWEAMNRAGGTSIDHELHPTRAGEVARSVLDAGFMQMSLGVACDTPLEAGLAATLTWLGGRVSA